MLLAILKKSPDDCADHEQGQQDDCAQAHEKDEGICDHTLSSISPWCVLILHTPILPDFKPAREGEH